MGTIPLDDPLVPLMYELEARTLWQANPMPPAYFEMTAHCYEKKIEQGSEKVVRDTAIMGQGERSEYERDGADERIHLEGVINSID